MCVCVCVQAKQLQESKELGKVMQETLSKSSQRFPLSDLLSVPMQRILKYPLLIMVRDGQGCRAGCCSRGVGGCGVLLATVACSRCERVQELVRCAEKAEKKVGPRNSVAASLSNLNAVLETLQVCGVLGCACVLKQCTCV